MKLTDFSFSGGFPLDLDVLEWDRNGLWEAIAGLYAGAGTTPLIISGVHTGSPNGWVFVDGKLMPYIAPAIFPPLGPSDAYYLRINKTANPAVYEDTTTHDVLEVSYYVDLVVAPISTPPASSYLFDDFKRWEAVVLGPRSKTAWATLWSAATGTVTGSIIYKKDLLANTLRLVGTIGISTSVFSGSEATTPVYRSFAPLLPDGFRPSVTIPFQALRRYHGSVFLHDAAGFDNIHSINCEVRSTGALYFGFIKPDAAITSYSVSFDHIISLD